MRVRRRVVVEGFNVRFCGVACAWEGVYVCQDFEDCFLCKMDVISECAVSECAVSFFFL